jgi:hypothetical protein
LHAWLEEAIGSNINDAIIWQFSVEYKDHEQESQIGKQVLKAGFRKATIPRGQSYGSGRPMSVLGRSQTQIPVAPDQASR